MRIAVNCIAVASLPFLCQAQNESVDLLRFPTGLTPVYATTSEGHLPIAYVEPADTCRVDSTVAQGDSIIWVHISSGSKRGWIRSSALQRASEAGEGSTSRRSFHAKDPDAKRRYRVLEKSPEWPRRIIRAVRDGTICLDMNEAQLVAAWGAPFQKSSAFILGAGSQQLWHYKDSKGRIQVVVLSKGRVVGWSQ
ncbi:MAG: hypothetical protein JW768_08775 [Chitinispirillaceae bacterium]|nr:hypothetical protein [Chitinispirillaceae bacterium]